MWFLIVSYSSVIISCTVHFGNRGRPRTEFTNSLINLFHYLFCYQLEYFILIIFKSIMWDICYYSDNFLRIKYNNWFFNIVFLWFNKIFLVLSIDPLTGRIKTDHDFNDEGMLFGGAPQEGLTPHHLKKAKLMFFYCRYPSSNVLKTYFPDVKVSFKNSFGVLAKYVLQ